MRTAHSLHDSCRPRSAWAGVGLPAPVALAGLTALLTLTACDAGPVPTTSPQLSLWFAPLEAPLGCGQTGNGRGTLPAELQTLVVRLSATAGSGPVQQTVRVSRDQVAASGSWLIRNIPASTDLHLELFGCDAAGQIGYLGRHGDLRVDAGRDTPVRVFLSPVAGLACAGAPSGGALQTPRALVGTAALPDGQVAVVGGMGEWQGSSGEGKASAAVDLFTPHAGQWRPGPDLLVPRIRPHVLAVADNKLLVVGGLTALARSGDVAALPSAFVLAPPKVASAVPAVQAELVDVGVPSAKPVASPSAVGNGAYALSSAARSGDDWVFVGGYDTVAGGASSGVTRLGGLGAVAEGLTGTATPGALAWPRLRPGLVAASGNQLVVWGGAVQATEAPARLGELLGPTGQAQPLAVSGPESLLTDPNLMTVDPTLVPLPAATAQQVRFLVVGGSPVANPGRAVAAPSYVVLVDLTARTAALQPIALPDGPLRGALHTAAAPLPDGTVLLAGGLLALDDAGICTTAQECLSDRALRLAVPDASQTGPLTAAVVHSWPLGGPRLGMAAWPTPLGAVLAGGLESIRTGSGPSGLDAAGAVVTAIPPGVVSSAICGP